MADDNTVPEIDIKARQQEGKAHVEVEVSAASSIDEDRKRRQEERKKRQQEREKRQKEREEQKKQEEESSGFTIAGYTIGELVKAPLEPPNEKDVGKRSPKTE